MNEVVFRLQLLDDIGDHRLQMHDDTLPLLQPIFSGMFMFVLSFIHSLFCTVSITDNLASVD